jgi:topoisomerase-4 subunit A
MFAHVPGRKLLVAATSGHGFITNEDDAVAMTKNGKRVMNVKPGVEAVSCRPGAMAIMSRWWARTASC